MVEIQHITRIGSSVLGPKPDYGLNCFLEDIGGIFFGCWENVLETSAIQHAQTTPNNVCYTKQVVLLLGHNSFLEPTLILTMRINMGNIDF